MNFFLIWFFYYIRHMLFPVALLRHTFLFWRIMSVLRTVIWLKDDDTQASFPRDRLIIITWLHPYLCRKHSKRISSYPRQSLSAFISRGSTWDAFFLGSFALFSDILSCQCSKEFKNQRYVASRSPHYAPAKLFRVISRVVVILLRKVG